MATGRALESHLEGYFKRKLPRHDGAKDADVVFVEENEATLGAGRIVLAHAVSWISNACVLHVQLENEVATGDSVLNYTGDVSGWLEPGSLVDKVLADVTAAATGSPTVVVIDSLTPLLQSASFHCVLQAVRALRKLSGVLALITRFSASVHPKHMVHALRAQATVYLLVETPASIAAHHFLSKESKRTIPPGMDGTVVMIRRSQNGKATEAIDYFQLDANSLRVYASTDPLCSGEVAAPEPSPATALAADVSFNLAISEKDQQAKEKVQLPYTHQGKQQLFFIDEDDPDWDDDDLDDDLDI
ncbi:hypothetical protein ACHHYP_04868 [Achlya hypogyna]|uniref:Elongator complex protein 5 n=1 Tax=Achlya hypogyna TaxID=1202772 RepID=A0A1V9ZNX8_ACHHY|nr:hypothetical protein ACHHYP_04868 [Achlya hypogyna]